MGLAFVDYEHEAFAKSGTTSNALQTQTSLIDRFLLRRLTCERMPINLLVHEKTSLEDLKLLEFVGEERSGYIPCKLIV